MVAAKVSVAVRMEVEMTAAWAATRPFAQKPPTPFIQPHRTRHSTPTSNASLSWDPDDPSVIPFSVVATDAFGLPNKKLASSMVCSLSLAFQLSAGFWLSCSYCCLYRDA